MANVEGGDRRGSERFQTLNLLNYYELDSLNVVCSHGIAKTLDLSESGACIGVPREFKQDAGLEFEIALEDEIVKLQAEIVEQVLLPSGDWQVRVKFVNMRPMLKHRLFSFFREIK
jgi:hypothetical protein